MWEVRGGREEILRGLSFQGCPETLCLESTLMGQGSPDLRCWPTPQLIPGPDCFSSLCKPSIPAGRVCSQNAAGFPDDREFASFFLLLSQLSCLLSKAWFSARNIYSPTHFLLCCHSFMYGWPVFSSCYLFSVRCLTRIHQQCSENQLSDFDKVSSPL